MDSNQVRQTFLDFFKSKGHEIVPSAPLVIKNDPTLMFTNAGMNQFKDLFLGNTPVKFSRIADTQKCLRVSGKHNDLEEVGVDTYHHTMFEMLGNWSFGDPASPAGGYFKKEAIGWAWELLTDVYKLPKDRLYATVFEGDAKEKLAFDDEAKNEWKKYISEDRILKGNKKDNFWEMGDTGPCGPCSEIHIDLRPQKEIDKKDGKSGRDLVNQSDPQVIEIWNLVFMEFNRKADGSLEKLPARHVDTGMGFERLCRAIEAKNSNYDTDVFQPIIHQIEKLSGKKYSASPQPSPKEREKVDIAMRVIADHLRAVSFSIADGQLPSNTGAGYVIRRILRRAIRYGYQSLELKDPFIFTLVPVLAEQMGKAFPELTKQKSLIEKVIKEEEGSFLRTLETGIKRFEKERIELESNVKWISGGNTDFLFNGAVAFELSDTFGFPLDLTALMAREKGYAGVEMNEYNELLSQQKNRSRKASSVETGDWLLTEAKNSLQNPPFVGYEKILSNGNIIQYRTHKIKEKQLHEIVLDQTPFYAESGGQIGDKGTIEYLDETKMILQVHDTKKENGLIIHYVDQDPVFKSHLDQKVVAKVDKQKRLLTENNHSATHLLHAALRKVLGTHVEQKGSLVNDEYLRFDFSHFSAVSLEELRKVEKIVNEKIRENIEVKTAPAVPIEEAKKRGAMALFGEKYGDTVRVVTIGSDYSIELCGGTHVRNTGEIDFFLVTQETAVASGIRRIEARTAQAAFDYIQEQFINPAEELKGIFKKMLKDIPADVRLLIDRNARLSKQVEALLKEKAKQIKSELITKAKQINGINLIAEKIELDSAEEIKDLSFELRNQVQNLVMVIGSEVNGKPMLSVIISDNLVKEKNLNAGNIIRELAKEIQGGGGGQAFYATAGGSNAEGLSKAIEKAKTLIS